MKSSFTSVAARDSAHLNFGAEFAYQGLEWGSACNYTISYGTTTLSDLRNSGWRDEQNK